MKINVGNAVLSIPQNVGDDVPYKHIKNPAHIFSERGVAYLAIINVILSCRVTLPWPVLKPPWSDVTMMSQSSVS